MHSSNVYVTQRMFEKRMKQQMINDRKDREMAKEKARLLNLQAYCDSDAKIDSLRRSKKHFELQMLQNEILSKQRLKEKLEKESQENEYEEAIIKKFRQHKSEMERKESINKRICDT